MKETQIRRDPRRERFSIEVAANGELTTFNVTPRLSLAFYLAGTAGGSSVPPLKFSNGTTRIQLMRQHSSSGVRRRSRVTIVSAAMAVALLAPPAASAADLGPPGYYLPRTYRRYPAPAPGIRGSSTRSWRRETPCHSHNAGRCRTASGDRT
jgi:hypothetical protein